ncbi:MAG: TetR/AcrR family transcriptional regulator [Melioribacteraceae bacterium]|jgi:AcrR family transcriptional regulator|nr:TetR/AcrR family transcriptional regulator [Melioribacteraceae bacterium]WKZ70042.1 MAG: TetR/AcrR family transcriptional regulator [Melioribacteraceae bacterium]
MTKKEIQKYLAERFQAEGFQNIPVDEIASELKISKKTIYTEFENKYMLIDNTISKMLNEAYGDVIYIVANESPFIEKFYTIFDIVKKNLKAFDDISLLELKRSYPEIWIKVARFRKYNIIPLLRLLITSGIKKGVLNDYPAELYLKLIYGAITEVTRRNTKHFECELDQLLKIVLNGALTKKGKRFLNYKLVPLN